MTGVQTCALPIYINPVWFSNALTHPHDKSGGFQFIQRTLDRHEAAGQDCGNGCDREADKKNPVLVRLPSEKHSVQHPAVHDLCGAADWKSCQCSGEFIKKGLKNWYFKDTMNGTYTDWR